MPLHAHSEWGNNRKLDDRLGLIGASRAEASLVWQAETAPMVPADLVAHIGEVLGCESLHLHGGTIEIHRVAWCTGSAQGYIAQTATVGCDAFISSNASEQTSHQAAELGLHLYVYAAGHHANERYGVQPLGRSFGERFGLFYHFIDILNDIPNPV